MKNTPYPPKHVRGPNYAAPSKRITYLSYILSIIANHVKSDPCLKSTNALGALFDEVKHHGGMEDLSSNM